MASESSNNQKTVQPAFIIEFQDNFGELTLSPTKWIPHYLPQWTTPEKSIAFYTPHPGMLTLEIHAEQLPWIAIEGSLRVSNLQTAIFSGQVGSDLGTHRHRPELCVQTPQVFTRLYTPSAPARVEATLRAYPHQDCMLAFWLVGVGDASPQESGEICVVEIFGHKTGHVVPGNEQGKAILNVGVKKHNDPDLQDDMMELVLPDFDACEWHTYTAEWDEHEIRLSIDGKLCKTSPQTILYPMQIMIDLFEFSKDEESRRHEQYPKRGDVKEVKGGRLVAAQLEGYKVEV